MDPNRLLTQREVAEILRISPKKLQIMRRTGQISFITFGHRTIRFRPSEIQRLLGQKASA
jgi:excisionase family DNA binding protein